MLPRSGVCGGDEFCDFFMMLIGTDLTSSDFVMQLICNNKTKVEDDRQKN